MCIATVGAIALAMMFAVMSRPAARRRRALCLRPSGLRQRVQLHYLGTSGAPVFTTLVLMTGMTSAIPYAFSALAQISWRWRDHQRGHTPRFFLDLSLAVVALAVSIAFIYYSRNTGSSWFVVWGPFLMAGGASALGIPVYLRMRSSMTEPVPDFR